MSDSWILDQCRAAGVDYARLSACLSSHDNWGKLVHSFEYLTVLAIVEQAMAREAQVMP